MRLVSGALLLGILGYVAAGCGTTMPEKPPEPSEEELTIVKLEEKTRKLVETSEKLQETRVKLDDQVRRLQVICADHPEHQVCQPQTEAAYAREAFCSDKEFVSHVDEIVRSCHQGACKQVDQAEFITRAQYMTLLTRLPHKLVLFGNAVSRLDNVDKKQLQQFVEQIQAERGYVIIVGRASRDGPWKQNVKLALKRAENTRQYVVENLGVSERQVGWITYGHPKMYLTDLDADRLSTGKTKLTVQQANRSAFVFVYPCHVVGGQPQGAH